MHIILQSDIVWFEKLKEQLHMVPSQARLLFVKLPPPGVKVTTIINTFSPSWNSLKANKLVLKWYSTKVKYIAHAI